MQWETARGLREVSRSIVLLLWLTGCGDDSGGNGSPHGPPGGVLTVDPGAIPTSGTASGGGPGAGGAPVGAGASLGAGGLPLGAGAVSGTGGATGSGGSTSGSGGVTGSGGLTAGTGGTAPQPHCTGSATPCSLLTASRCASALGCSMSGTCDGFASFCSSQFSSYSCASLEGCYWSSSSKYCSGVSWSCDLFHGPATCVGQEGCSWTEACDGVATSCDSLSESSCALQPGCVVEYR